MSKGRIFRLLLLPVLIGLAVTLTSYLYLSRQQPKVAPVKLVAMVVAKADVPARTKLTPEMLGTRQIPAEYAGPNEIARLDEALGRVTTVPLTAGESILRTQLAGADEKTALSYRIPEGKRAMTIKVNEVIGVAGFPEPGDHVDILGTFGKDVAGQDKTRVIVQDVLVLAVSRTQPGGAGKDKSDNRVPTSITLAISPEEALSVTFTEERGALRLLLRPALPDRAAKELEFNGTMLGGPGPSTSPAPAAPSKPSR